MVEEVERCCKAILLQKQYRKIKEVYEADIDMIKQVINGCTELALTAFDISNVTQAYIIFSDVASVSALDYFFLCKHEQNSCCNIPVS